MKFLLLLAVVLLGVWLWRSGRASQTGAPDAPRNRAPAKPHRAGPQEMVRCAQCGLHLPLTEAVASSSAHYCSVEHRRLAEPGTY